MRSKSYSILSRVFLWTLTLLLLISGLLLFALQNTRFSALMLEHGVWFITPYELRVDSLVIAPRNSLRLVSPVLFLPNPDSSEEYTRIQAEELRFDYKALDLWRLFNEGKDAKVTISLRAPVYSNSELRFYSQKLAALLTLRKLSKTTLRGEARHATLKTEPWNLASNELAFSWNSADKQNKSNLMFQGDVALKNKKEADLNSPYVQLRFRGLASESSTMTLEARELGGVYRNHEFEKVELSLAADLPNSNSPFVIRGLDYESKSEDSELHLKGAIPISENPQGSAMVDLRSLPVSTLFNLYSSESLEQGGVGVKKDSLGGRLSGSFSSEFIKDSLSVRIGEGSLDLVDFNFDSLKLQSLSLRGEIKKDSDLIELRKLGFEVTQDDGRILDVAVDGKLVGEKSSQRENGSDKQRSEIALSGSLVDVSEIQKLFSSFKETGWADALASEDKQDSTSTQDQSKKPGGSQYFNPILVSIDLGKIRYDKREFSSLRGKVSYAAEQLELNNIKFFIDDSLARFEAKLNLEDEPYAFDYTLNATDLPLETVLSLAAKEGSDKVAGHFRNLSIEGKGQGFAPAELRENLETSLRAELENLVLTHDAAEIVPFNVLLKPLQLVGEIASLVPNTKLPPGIKELQNVVFGTLAKGGRNFEFRRGNLKASFENSVLQVSEFNLRSEAFADLSLEARVDFTEEEAKLNARATILYGGGTLAIPMAGSLSNPVPDVSHLVQDFATSLGISLVNVPLNLLQNAYAAGITAPLRALSNPVDSLTNPMRTALSPLKAFLGVDKLEETKGELAPMEPVVVSGQRGNSEIE